MATFRGTLSGSRHSVSRLGHSNLTVTAHGWQGGVSVYLYRENDTDHADIWLNQGSSNDGERVRIYHGPIDLPARIAERNKFDKRIARIKAIGIKA